MMRKLFWAIVLVGAYLWIVTSGNDELLLKRGKALYKAVVTWLDSADIDYNLKKESPRKSNRRWD